MDQIAASLASLKPGDPPFVIISTLVIIAVAALISRLMTKALRRALSKDGSPLPSASIIANIARMAVWCLAISIVLDSVLGINISAIVATLGVGGVALSLGLKDTLSNFIGGLQVTLMGLVQPGDNIEVGNQTGVVQDVNWRHTTISNRAGETVYIPNSIISTTALAQLPPAECVKVSFAVNEGDADLDEVRSLIAQAACVAAETICPLASDPLVSFNEITEYGFRGKVSVEIEDAAFANDVVDAIVRAIAPVTRGNASPSLEAPSVAGRL